VARIIVIIVFVASFVGNTVQEQIFKKKNRETKGKLPIQKGLFILGKVSLVLSWFLAFLQAVGVNLRMLTFPDVVWLASSLVFFLGFIIVAIAYFSLGYANTTGFPEEKFALNTKGLYRISRNPIYSGFILMCLGSTIFTANIAALILSLIGIIIHHKIIIAEEAFLQKRLGPVYSEYKKKARRYGMHLQNRDYGFVG